MRHRADLRRAAQEGVLTRAWKSVNRASNMATYDPVRSSEYKARLDRLRQRMRDLERALDQKWAKEFESVRVCLRVRARARTKACRDPLPHLAGWQEG